MSFDRRLVLVLFLQLLCDENVHTKEMTGIIHKDINIPFINTSLSVAKVKTVSLYKDKNKIGECDYLKTTCSFSHGQLHMLSEGVKVTFQNLSMEDSGNYSVTFFLSTSTLPLESGLVSLIVKFEGHTTEPPPHGGPESSPASISYVYVIIALLITIMVLPAVALMWFYQSLKRNTDVQQPPKLDNDYQAGRQTRNMQVCSIEYEALEFHSSSHVGRTAKQSHKPLKCDEAVEYATITFPQG